MQTTIKTKLYKDEVTVEFVENKETGYHAYFITDPVKGLARQRAKGCTTIIGVKDKSAALVSWATRLARQHLENKLIAGQAITLPDITEACNLHKVRKQEAATVGDETHEWIEYFIKDALGIKGFKTKVSPKKKEVKIGVNAFLDWLEKDDVQFISSERTVYSREGLWIGTADWEAMVGGGLALGDTKTSNGLYNTVRLQTAGYASADMEEYNYSHPDNPKKYQKRVAIRLSKETEEEYYKRMKEKESMLEIPDYQMFEVMEFVETPDDNIATDYFVFRAAQTLFEWDLRTDFYRNRQKTKV